MNAFFSNIKGFIKQHRPKVIAGVVVVAALSLPFVINQVLKQQDVRQRADTAPSITFSFSPGSQNMMVNQTINVDLVMNAGTNDIGALHFSLKYDPTMLNVTDLAQSTALQSITKTNNQQQGVFDIVMINPTVTPVTGNGLKVFTFQLKALKTGTANIALDPTTLQATSQLSNTYLLVDNKDNIKGNYTITAGTVDSNCNVTSNKPANCTCTVGTDCVSGVCSPSTTNQDGKVCVGGAPSTTLTTTVSPSVSPTPTPKQISCLADSQQITFDMKSPISVKANNPITSVTLNSGNWCAWAAGNNDPNSQGRCPLKCPEVNPTDNSTTTPITISTDKLSFRSDFDSVYTDNTGSCTYSVSCTATNTSPTLTTTVTTTVTSTVTTSPSVTPSQIPTVTLAPGETGLKLSLSLPGISKINGENDHPIRTRRTVKVAVYDSNGTTEKVAEKTGTVDFNPTTTKYEGIVGIGTTLDTGTYTVKVRMDNTLKKQLPGVISVTKGKADNNTQPVELVTGDLDQDNTLDVQDYTNIMACYNHQTACTGDILILGDLDDDGITNGDNDDVNIMQYNTINRIGD